MKDVKFQPFSEHIRELRKRFLYVIMVVVVGCGFGYAIHEPLFRILKRPLEQELYYNTPIGGFNAMLKISVLVGLVVGIPFLFYQICQFLAPAFKRLGAKRPIKILVSSLALATLGVAFGYFVSLPAALRFLTNYDSQNITPLIIVGEYLNFVFSYLLGFAVLFQLPLIMLFINRIKPQNPRNLMKKQRWVVLFSFIIAAVLTPTPDPVNQLIMAAPVILLYQISVGLVWLQNRRTRNKKIAEPQPAVAHVKSSAPKLLKKQIVA
ncbi:MAG: twin-arginine translocase subunit TatC [Candidatus Saccharibacteria bacterium]|nr:twin-arginine translocase subunit TatC [Candidatus Saccharibacteria bacterium]